MIRHNAFNADEKILKHIDKLNNFYNGHKTLIVAELDLTNRCNNNCPKCIGNRENGEELSLFQIKNIVESLREIEVRGVILSGGGDPLVSPHFVLAIELLRKAGIKIGVNSNGLALDKTKSVCIADSCEFFRVSLDAACHEMYTITHGMSASIFDKVVENCKRFVKIRQALESRTSFGIGYLTCVDTILDMEKFVILTRDIGADFAQFRPFQDDTEDVSNEILRLQNLYGTDRYHVTGSLQKYKEMAKMLSEDSRLYKNCMGMFFSTVITADAKVFSCLHHRQSQRHYLGNLNTHTLTEIFRSARIREVYESIDCSRCPSLCRNDAFNRMLNTLSMDINHIEFL